MVSVRYTAGGGGGATFRFVLLLTQNFDREIFRSGTKWDKVGHFGLKKFQ